MTKKLSAYNLHMRRALKGKMRGKTKAQRKAIFKAAAKSWKGKGTVSKRFGRRVKKTNPRTSRSKAKTRTIRKSNPVSKRRGFLTTSTFMKFARLFALAAPAAAIATGAGDPQSKIKEGAKVYTGFDMDTGTWSLANLARGWLPYLGTSFVTHGISKVIGMIRRL